MSEIICPLCAARVPSDQAYWDEDLEEALCLRCGSGQKPEDPKEKEEASDRSLQVPSAERLEWVKRLRPGDLVCDCKHQHRRIVQVEDIETTSEWATCLGAIVCMFVCAPVGILLMFWLMSKGHTQPYDKRVWFEDGSTCTALKCLDPVGPGCLHD